MSRVELFIRETDLPADAEPMAGHDLSTGNRIELTIAEWAELHAWLDLGQADANYKRAFKEPQ
jgi:hypothetical protein